MTIPPVPSSPTGELARSCVILDAAGWRLAWLIERREEPFGEVFPSVKAAVAASLEINAQIDKRRRP